MKSPPQDGPLDGRCHREEDPLPAPRRRAAWKEKERLARPPISTHTLKMGGGGGGTHNETALCVWVRLWGAAKLPSTEEREFIRELSGRRERVLLRLN